MSALIESQVFDALVWQKSISHVLEKTLPEEPKWGHGKRLVLPAIIPLISDAPGETAPVAWLVVNDFNRYDLTTEDPRV